MMKTMMMMTVERKRRMTKSEEEDMWELRCFVKAYFEWKVNLE